MHPMFDLTPYAKREERQLPHHLVMLPPTEKPFSVPREVALRRLEDRSAAERLKIGYPHLG